MIYKDNAVKDLRIAYIGGGSRGWAWTFMRDLALEPALGGTIVLYDINKEAAKANEVIETGLPKDQRQLENGSMLLQIHLQRHLRAVILL